MTPTEARQVLHNLTRRSHHHELDADDQITWTNALARFDLDAAMIAVTNLGHEAGFPTLERLIVECQHVTKRLVAAPADVPPTPDARETRNTVGLAGVRRARAALAAHPLPFPEWNAETEPAAS